MQPQPAHQLPPISKPINGQHPSTNILQSAGVAIFHLRTSRVVVCYHTNENYWFLPKGRRDVGEGVEAAGEREGFEESGYLNRLLPLPILHCQTHPSHIRKEDRQLNVTEPVWVQLKPHNRTVQYILHWYVAETVPPDIEEELSAAMGQPAHDGTAKPAGEGDRAESAMSPPYCQPPPFPKDMKLRDRIAMEPADYEPHRHPGTGLEDDEKYYESYLLSVEDAMEKLRGTVEADVVRIGQEAIERRLGAEAG